MKLTLASNLFAGVSWFSTNKCWIINDIRIMCESIYHYIILYHINIHTFPYLLYVLGLSHVERAKPHFKNQPHLRKQLEDVLKPSSQCLGCLGSIWIPGKRIPKNDSDTISGTVRIWSLAYHGISAGKFQFLPTCQRWPYPVFRILGTQAAGVLRCWSIWRGGVSPAIGRLNISLNEVRVWLPTLHLAIPCHTLP